MTKSLERVEYLNRAFEEWFQRQEPLEQRIVEFSQIFSLDDQVWTAVESPLEVIFYVEWLAHRGAACIAGDGRALGLCPQVDVAGPGYRYRLDFAVVPLEPIHNVLLRKLQRPLLFAVELDGHDFHERTVEQVAYRNRRDRDLQAVGWRLFHFSGAEIHRQAHECVREVYTAACEFIDGIVHDVANGWGVTAGPLTFNEPWLRKR